MLPVPYQGIPCVQHICIQCRILRFFFRKSLVCFHLPGFFHRLPPRIRNISGNQFVFIIDQHGDDKAADVRNQQPRHIGHNAVRRPPRTGCHHKNRQKSGGTPGSRRHLQGHHQSAAKAGTKTGGDERLPEGKGNTIDQRLSDSQKTSRESAGDHQAELPVSDLLRLDIQGDRRTDLAGSCHGQRRIQGDIPQLLQLHGVQRHHPVVHARGNQRQEQRCGNIPCDDPDKDVSGQTQLAEDPYDPAGHITQQRHDHQNVGDHTDQQGQKRRENNIDGFRHPGTDLLFDDGQQEYAQDDRQYTALPGSQHRIQGILLIVQTQQQGNLVDPLHGSDHAQHTTQDRRGAEALRCPISGPGCQIGQKGAVYKSQQIVNKAPDLVCIVIRNSLGDQRRQTRTQSGGNDPRYQGNEDIAHHLQSGFHRAFLLPAAQIILVFLPVRLRFSCISRCCRKPQRMALVRIFSAFARTHHNLIGALPVMDKPHHILHGLELFLFHQAFLLHDDPEPGHTVGC